MQLPYLEQQLNFVIELTQHRTPLLNFIFFFINYFDTPYFAAFLIPLIWFGFSYRWGLKVAYLFLITSILNSVLKYSFGLPRPTVAMPELGMFLFKSPGFPSGGAQTAMLLGSLLMHYYKTFAAYFWGIFYILLISFSRLYLGVHYPIDILGGWIIGYGIFRAFIAVEKPIDRLFMNHQPLLPIAIVTVVSVALIKVYPLTAPVLTLSFGALIGLKYHLYPQPSKNFWRQLFKGIFAGLTTLLFGFLIPKSIPFPIVSALLGLWISLGLGILFYAINRCRNPTH